MNLLIFIHSLHSGGAERVTANLANHWANKGWRVTVVTLSSSVADFYKLHSSVQRIGLDVAGDSPNPLIAIPRNICRVLALRQVLRKIKPDVALAMMSTANILLALAATGLKDLVTIGSEHIYPPQIYLGRAWEVLRSRIYCRLDAVAALTKESATWLRQRTNVRQVTIIPNAVPWPFPTQAPLLPVPISAKGRYILLAVGRLDQQKGFDLLIQAFLQLANEFPKWDLFILGEGPEREALEAQIISGNLEGRVSLPGRAGNVGQWYEKAGLYVMSSRFEGFGNTLAEAMAYGVPAISFDCDAGPRDIIRHNIDGLLVPAGDTVALETGLRRLMSDGILRQQFGACAAEARDRFSLVRIAGMWEKLFLELR